MQVVFAPHCGAFWNVAVCSHFRKYRGLHNQLQPKHTLEKKSFSAKQLHLRILCRIELRPTAIPLHLVLRSFVRCLQ
jgi:hypothetical protein